MYELGVMATPHLHEVLAVAVLGRDAAEVNDPPVGPLTLSAVTCVVAVAPGAVHENLFAQGDQLASLHMRGGGRCGRDGERTVWQAGEEGWRDGEGERREVWQEEGVGTRQRDSEREEGDVVEGRGEEEGRRGERNEGERGRGVRRKERRVSGRKIHMYSTVVTPYFRIKKNKQTPNNALGPEAVSSDYNLEIRITSGDHNPVRVITAQARLPSQSVDRQQITDKLQTDGY